MDIRSKPTTNAFSAVGDLSSLQSSDLLFVYPIIFDSKLERRYGKLIREFQTLQFISQIKVANILNITKSAVKKEESPNTNISPAELLSNILNNNANQDAMYRFQLSQQNSLYSNNNIDRPHPRDIEYKLKEKYEFIRSHLASDPRYANLDPVFSLITVENNLIEIPLILGSKVDKINSQGLYWILFLSAAMKLPLNNSGNINDIAGYISKIPKHNYINLLSNSDIIKDSPASDQNTLYNKLRGEAVNDLRKAGEKFNMYAGSIANFESEIGISTAFKSKEDISYKNIIGGTDSITSKAELKSKVNTLLSQVLQESVFPVIQTYNNIIVDPSVEVSFSPKYEYLHREIINKSDNVTSTIIDQIANMFGEMGSASDYVKRFNGICNSINNLNPNNEFSSLSQLVLSYSNIRNAIGNIQNGTGDNTIFNNINESLFRTAELLRSKEIQITDFITKFTSGTTDANNINFQNVVNSYKESIQRNLHEFYYEQINSTDPIIKPPNNQNNGVSSIFRRLYNNDNLTRQRFDTFISNYLGSIANIITFAYLFSAIGYICDFIKVVENKVKIESANVIAFPNYTLVVPIEYIRTLYFAVSARNIVDIANNKDIPKEIEKFDLKETEIFRIINNVTGLLKIPNIVIIDEKSKVAYYKWVFSKSVLKVNFSTIENYIRSQKNIIRVN